ncbi:5-methyltetrahydropteroyltriglutamate--homocysteine S-methyltransferase [Salsipaludibacter albus]|uniref:5-methyltetrahydropteroyltriglutamate-- homocysteine S-methyltransferase n=1 Tax=Salsipaludibacter albus TaxID=2849650 RepID=UPI001EE4D75F|nr:5-methyltetrahydropteroyltriglutamate--homocysteine S-methyltransferase [Salsipaludibacter albus]MBY5162613.1 5-methyltetrahydropteroyltriglutamate--homocysteine S-methyltransferase [Salsipaludibacter albus]
MDDRPPFRADHVGSFLRPTAVMAARQRRGDGEIDAAALREIEDEAIADVVRRQQDVGLRGITDGEFRRFMFHLDFLEQLDGVTVSEGDFLARFRRDDGTEVSFSPPKMTVTDRIGHTHAIQGDDFDYLASRVDETPKVSIPAPSMLHFRGGRDAISTDVYPDLEEFFTDLAAAYREEVADLADRGCTYLQLDDTNLAYLCDPAVRASTAERGDDPDELTRLYCRLVNDAIAERPDDMVATVHLCRGNFQSAWVSEGGYEPVAEILLNEMAVDGFFLEYDDERSGDFAPLRHLPADKVVVLGLMSSKHPAVEDADEVKRRIEEAAAYAPLEQLALSHQCGFSSTAHGNQLEPDDQWRKLEQTVSVAQDVWG